MTIAKVPYDSLTLRCVVSELRMLLVGGQVQDIRQPTPTDIVLGIRNRNQSYRLILSADAQFARVHLTSDKRPNAPTPPTFCMTLRKYIEDGWIRAVRQRGFDRIFELEVGARDMNSDMPTVTLIAELMGKHSNLVLVNADGNILDAAKRISRRINRVRETLPGLAYQSPPEQPDRYDPFAPQAVEKIIRELPDLIQHLIQQRGDFSKSLAEALMQIYEGMSPFLAKELALRVVENADADQANAASLLRDAWNAIIVAAGQEKYQPTQIVDSQHIRWGAYPFPLVQAPAAQQESARSLNEALDATFTTRIGRARYEAISGDLRGRIEREIKRLERQRQHVARALEEAERAEGYRRTGELLLANLWQLQDNQKRVTVQDYYDPEMKEVSIELDATRTPQENAELYFQRYRKARDSQEKEARRGEEIDERLEQLRRAEQEQVRLATSEAVEALRDELQKRALLRANESTDPGEKQAGSEFEGHKIRRFTTPEGFDILVGESSTANDYLTTRIASSNDLWLHVRAAASAHVVIRTHGSPSLVPRSVLERAAVICAQHSAQKHSSLVSVDYTLKKYVRKPRGASAGSADYQKEFTIDVTP